MSWYVYIVQCSDSSLYTGVTTNLDRRVKQHNGEIKGGAKYTRSVRPVKLVWSMVAIDRSEAQKIELRLKKLLRSEKLELIRECRVPL